MSKQIKNYEGFQTIVAGITRHGKSYWVKKVLIPMLVRFKPVIVFDRKLEYAGRNARDHDPSWQHYHSIQDFFGSLLESEAITKQVHVIDCLDDEDYIRGLWFFKHLEQPVSIVLDEAHDIFLDRDFYSAKKALVKVCRYGAGFGVDLIMVTQRTMDIPPDVRSQFLSAISFRQNHEDDIKVLDKKGFTGTGQVIDLKKHQYKVFGDFPEHLNLNETVKS